MGANFLKIITILFLLISAVSNLVSQDEKLTIARVIYGGGGDWYSNPSSLPNLLREIRKQTSMQTAENEVRVELTSKDLFNYPYLYMNGHGNIKFTEEEVQRLRAYLTNGGFLHADDNFGMDKSFRREIKRVFPDKELVELPFDFPIYYSFYSFPNGLPKIHEHHGGPPRGYGIFHNGRLVMFYSFNTDLGDGWEDAEVHNDPPEKREAALKMGMNIFVYALTQ